MKIMTGNIFYVINDLKKGNSTACLMLLLNILLSQDFRLCQPILQILFLFES